MADRHTFVRMLTSMAGHVESLAYGEIVKVEAAVAEAWKAAGLAEDAPRAATAEKAARDAEARLADLEGRLADATADRDALRAQAEELGAQLARLEALLAAAAPPAQA